MAKAGLNVVGNPLHLLPDKRVLEARLGKDRTERSFAFQSMLKVNIAATANLKHLSSQKQDFVIAAINLSGANSLRHACFT